MVPEQKRIFLSEEVTLAEIIAKENALRDELVRLRELRKQLEAQVPMNYKN